jgi:hypothetical protein
MPARSIAPLRARPQVPDSQPDDLAPTRGVLFGAALGAVLWIMVAALYWACLRGAL